MADWFKFYENFFDEPRFQYAVHQLPEVTSVTVLLLCEHCRHKSDQIRWSGDEIDLLGYSAKLGVSPAKINEAVKLLETIRYISLQDGFIKFLKWNYLQSDYCRRLTREKEASVQKSPEKSRKVTLEERRGEEIRGEEPSLRSGGSESHFPEHDGRMTLQEVKDTASMIGLAEWKAVDWFNEMEGCGWLDHNRRPILNGRAVLTRVKLKWESDGRPASPPKPRGQKTATNPAVRTQGNL